MTSLIRRASILAILALTPAISLAGQVSVEGTHLCCGACVKAVNSTLTAVTGITNVTVDKDGSSVTYTAADAKAAEAGIAALAKAGFGGSAKHGDEELKFPTGVKTEATANTVTIKGVHNCCPGCAKAIESALKDVKGVASVKCEKQTCTVTGSDVSYTALIKALHGSGLHGTIAAE